MKNQDKNHQQYFNTLAKGFLLFFMFLFSFNSYSQEMLDFSGFGKSENQTKGKILKGSPLSLPFIDDFSDGRSVPNPELWLGNSVYINQTMAIDPPSIGVATFDCLNSQGQIHKNANYKVLFRADSLTSQPIDLSTLNAASLVKLSFYYQPQGRGDAPEAGDSLVLEFYSPTTQEWYHKWSVAGSSVKPFKLVTIPVIESIFLQKGFQFRFCNYGSLSSMLRPSMVTNADHWNLDYVYLDKARKDTVIRDVAFIYPLSSQLIGYEAIPWKHFKNLSNQGVKSNYTFLMKNNFNADLNVVAKISFQDLSKKIEGPIELGYQAPKAGKILQASAIYAYKIPLNTIDSSEIQIKEFIVTDGLELIKSNDTVAYTQVFKNYYAFDDGSAEAGYGITGEGTAGGWVASKFNTLQADTLQSVDMYFGQSLNNAGKKAFYLTIWNSVKGKPGEIIYQNEGVTPEYESKLNQYHKYYLDTVLVLRDTFFIGWQQVTSDFLNIGFDMNRKNPSRLLLNINNKWVQSGYDTLGTIMIRPCFGKPKLSTKVKNKTIASFDVVYNSENNIFIRQKEITIQNSDNIFTLYLFDIYGRLVLSDQISSIEKQLNINNLRSGVYLLKITDNIQINETHKILVIH